MAAQQKVARAVDSTPTFVATPPMTTARLTAG